jgi:hypothetical protein
MFPHGGGIKGGLNRLHMLGSHNKKNNPYLAFFWTTQVAVACKNILTDGWTFSVANKGNG